MERDTLQPGHQSRCNIVYDPQAQTQKPDERKAVDFKKAVSHIKKCRSKSIADQCAAEQHAAGPLLYEQKQRCNPQKLGFLSFLYGKNKTGKQKIKTGKNSLKADADTRRILPTAQGCASSSFRRCRIPRALQTRYRADCEHKRPRPRA